jgi:hypothetical protein
MTDDVPDLFGGDQFEVPDSVKNINWGPGPDVGPYIFSNPNTTLTPANIIPLAQPTGVWLTFEVSDPDPDGFFAFTDVRVHQSELEALRLAVGRTGYTAQFLEYGKSLEDVLNER